uniref:N/A n=1 Tax=Ganoderma boninense TaxID=34458 RepID=A0A5K1JUC4_9APHY|nr:N/A [Ganoderma boninense]
MPTCTNPPAIATFTSLTRITLVFYTLQWPLNLLAHVRSPHVRELKMKLSDDCLSDDEFADDAARLDNLLQRAPLSGVRRLTVVPFWHDARRGLLHRATWVRTVQARLPQCHARNILRTPTRQLPMER